MGLFTSNGTRQQRRMHKAAVRIQECQGRLRVAMAESSILQLDAFVDPREAFLDERGMPWNIVGLSGVSGGIEGQIISPKDETDLQTMRVRSRTLYMTNEFAANAVENLVDYVVGSGLSYSIQAVEGLEVDKDAKKSIAAMVDAFLEENDFPDIEREVVRRSHRDGEAFLQRFPRGKEDAANVLRFIEPADVGRPTAGGSEVLPGPKNESFGIRTDPDDVQEIVDYRIGRGSDGDWIPADEVHHVKINVDRNAKRGIPTLYPVRKRLEDALETVTWMNLLIRLQGSIGVLRTHEGSTKSQVQTFRDEQADVEARDDKTSKSRFFKQLRRPRTIDVPQGLKYEFPTVDIKAKDWVDVVQAQLRAPAARLRMPEWMLSMRLDAKFANAFASESPFVRMILGQQHRFKLRFIEILKAGIQAPKSVRVMITAEDGSVTEEDRPTWEALMIQAEPTSIEVRDMLKDTQANKILAEASVLSGRSWAARAGLDFDAERANLDDEQLASGSAGGIGSLGSEDDDEKDDEGDDEGDGVPTEPV